MDNRDQHAIAQLFDKLADVEHRAPERDREAEAYIRDRMSRQPGAPYYMAQTIVVQEQALEAAQARIQELEDEVASRPSGGGFFSSLFGGGNDRRPRGQDRRYDDRRYDDRRMGAYQQDGRYGGRVGGGGGFLAGAAQTAMGVAGGVLLGSAIAGMFSGDAEAADTSSAGDGGDSGQDFGGDDSAFGGADGGDFGGFDDI